MMATIIADSQKGEKSEKMSDWVEKNIELILNEMNKSWETLKENEKMIFIRKLYGAIDDWSREKLGLR